MTIVGGNTGRIPLRPLALPAPSLGGTTLRSQGRKRSRPSSKLSWPTTRTRPKTTSTATIPPALPIPSLGGSSRKCIKMTWTLWPSSRPRCNASGRLSVVASDGNGLPPHALPPKERTSLRPLAPAPSHLGGISSRSMGGSSPNPPALPVLSMGGIKERIALRPLALPP